jgi:hypothetical protein
MSSDIADAIESHVIVTEGTHRSGEAYRYEEDGWDAWDGAAPQKVEGVGTVKQTEQAGGEGQGDSAHIIFQITDESGAVKLYKKDGSYASFDGYYWDGDFYEAHQVEKTIKVYEAV